MYVRLIDAKFKVSYFFMSNETHINNYPGSKLLEEIMSCINKYSIKKEKELFVHTSKEFQ